MVSTKSIEKQLKRVGFNYHGWGRTEARELRNIILPDEEIFECVNGIYEGGFALLLATDVRVLLVDKKPLNYLTVEDLRFDMINEIDYNHRLIGANIKVSAGNKNLKFTSINQPRLRKLIGHVQFCMAESKKKQVGHQEGQNQHLERINEQLQSYLLAQYQQQQRLYEQLQNAQPGQATGTAPKQEPEPVRPSSELADYLFAQSLLAQHQAQAGPPPTPAATPTVEPAYIVNPVTDHVVDLYSEGFQEVFGNHDRKLANDSSATAQLVTPSQRAYNPVDINPLHIAYSKLPMALRNRRFGRPSFHAHSRDPASNPAKV